MSRHTLKHQLEILVEKSWHQVFVSSFKITLLCFSPFLLLRFIRRLSDENLSISDLIESRIIFDYVFEGIFYVFTFWIIVSFSCLLIWMNNKSRKTKR